MLLELNWMLQLKDLERIVLAVLFCNALKETLLEDVQLHFNINWFFSAYCLHVKFILFILFEKKQLLTFFPLFINRFFSRLEMYFKWRCILASQILAPFCLAQCYNLVVGSGIQVIKWKQYKQYCVTVMLQCSLRGTLYHATFIPFKHKVIYLHLNS